MMALRVLREKGKKMRPIDADALKLKLILKQQKVEQATSHLSFPTVNVFGKVCELVDSIPTLNFCANCGKLISNPSIDYEMIYCPFCGFKFNI